MSILTQSRKGGAPLLGSSIERLAFFIMRFVRALSQRRALGELIRLDDRMLKDIGLSRGDIDAAESLPLGRDPIALLVSRQASRSNSRSFNRHS